MAQEETKQDAQRQIPYTSFTTFINALDRLGENGIPSQVDPSVFPTYAGGTTSHLLAALRFFGAIDESGTPQPVLAQLVTKETRKATLGELVKSRYDKVFGAIDVATASPSQLDDAIRSYNVQGATHRKAKSFLLQVLEETGIPVSKHLKTKKRRAAPNGGGSRPRTRRRTQQPGAVNQEAQQAPSSRARSLRVSIGDSGYAELVVDFDPFEIPQEQREELMKLVDSYRDFDKKWNKN